MAPTRSGTELCSKRDCIAPRLMTPWGMTQRQTSKKESARATLASATKGIPQARFAESARKERGCEPSCYGTPNTVGLLQTRAEVQPVEYIHRQIAR